MASIDFAREIFPRLLSLTPGTLHFSWLTAVLLVVMVAFERLLWFSVCENITEKHST